MRGWYCCVITCESIAAATATHSRYALHWQRPPPMAVVDEPSPLLGQQRHQPRRRCCAVHSRRSGAWCTHAGNHKISACHANNQHGQAPTIPSPGLRSPCHSRARALYTVRVQRPAATQLHPHRTWTRRSRCPGSTTLNEPGTTHTATSQHAPSGRALVARCTCGAKRVKKHTTQSNTVERHATHHLSGCMSP